jgi:hypothetical protein
MRIDAMMTENATDVGERISSRIVESMKSIRDTTESAVLEIGRQLGEIVRIAKDDNDAVQSMFGGAVAEGQGQASADGGLSITRAIDKQLWTVDGYVAESRTFLTRQLEFAQAAGEACDRIADCARGVSALMKRSHLLALNMQIESSRLGIEGRPISAIGEEMKSFSLQVRTANEAIGTALQSLTSSIPVILAHTQKMEQRTGGFSTELGAQVAEVKRHTGQLTNSLQSVLERSKQRNDLVVKASLATLSELQFQDPMAQKLKQAEFDVGKLQQLIVARNCDDVNLADIDPVVGHDGSAVRETGEVELF